MPLIAIPNVSTADETTVASLTQVVGEQNARVIDVHRDDEHGRSVLTCTGTSDALVAAMSALAIGARERIDLRTQTGEHPRVGALDVCPFVPHEVAMDEAVAAARATARGIGAAGIPVLLYGEASEQQRTLPELRRGGLGGLKDRVIGGLTPDEGPATIDPSTGVVCVGARDVLIAFNVWIDREVSIATKIASQARSGLEGVRALGLEVSSRGASQVSMNLIAPHVTGIDDAYAFVENAASELGAMPVATEIVGLVPERFLPSSDAKVARLLIEPGHSLEATLRA